MSRTTFELQRHLPTKIIDAKKQGKIRITWLNPSQYFYDIRLAGEAAPTSVDAKTWTRLDDRTLIINQKEPVDVYFYAASEDGRIQLDSEGDYLDVNLQDQTTPVVIVPSNLITDITATTTETTIGGRTVDVADTTGIIARNPATGVPGSFLIFYSDDTQRVYIGRVIAIAVNTVTFDSEFDSVFPIGTVVDVTTTEMNVDGSGTPVVFGVRGPSVPGQLDFEFDITRMLITITCEDQATLATFGDISPSLLRGVLLRHRNGTTQNIYNIKSNGELATICYDVTIYEAQNPNQGQNGLNARITFAGQNKMGVVLRLAPGEDLEVVIQDDLTSLTRFGMIFEGHVVD